MLVRCLFQKIVLTSLKEIFRCNFKKAKTEFYQIVTYSHILNSALLYRLNNKLDYYSICLYDYYIPEHLMKNNMGIDVSFIDAIKGTNITEQDLIQPNSNLIIRAHGEGTHLNLNNIVLCSCSNIKECRKAYLKKPVAFSNIRANNVVLFTCNGIPPALSDFSKLSYTPLIVPVAGATKLLLPSNFASAPQGWSKNAPTLTRSLISAFAP